MKFLSEMNPNNFDEFLSGAIKTLQLHNELAAEKAKNERLTAEIAVLKSKNNLLREAGDDLWYCVRHNDKAGMQEAVEEWRDARND